MCMHLLTPNSCLLLKNTSALASTTQHQQLGPSKGEKPSACRDKAGAAALVALLEGPDVVSCAMRVDSDSMRLEVVLRRTKVQKLMANKRPALTLPGAPVCPATPASMLEAIFQNGSIQEKNGRISRREATGAPAWLSYAYSGADHHPTLS